MGIDKIPDLPLKEQEPKEGLIYNQGEKKESQESGEQFRLEPLAENLRRIASSLARREQENLNPLIDERAISSIRSIATKLESFSGKEGEVEEVGGEISRLVIVFDSFGEVPKQRMVREDIASLKRLAFQIREFGDVCLTLKSHLGSKEKQEYEQIISTLNRIMSRGEKVWL